jgi:glutamyl-tRNA reductase
VKQLPDESYEQWVKRVEQYEFGRALMRLAQGDDPEQVLKETSSRMINKFQHPILEAINAIPSDYDSKASQQHYKTNYQDQFGPKPDHIKEHP